MGKKCGRCYGLGKIKVWLHMYPEPPRFDWKQCPRCLGKGAFIKLVETTRSVSKGDENG